MTTRAEVKHWVRPLLEWRSDLTLHPGGLLLLTPVNHLMRGVFIWPTSSREMPKVGRFIQPLFFAPSGSEGVSFAGGIPVGSSSEPDFQQVFENRIWESLERFVRPIDTIAKFQDYAVVYRPQHEGGFSASTLDRQPLNHALVLAALGRVAEAKSILEPALADAEEQIRATLSEGAALLAKRPRSQWGRHLVAEADRRRPIHAELRRLLDALRREDRSAITALLHEWEGRAVAKRKIEHLWEPTPFPIEQGAGD